MRNRTNEIREFRARFGNDIPDNMLSIFFDEDLLPDVLNHQIGRELIYDVLRMISVTIKSIAYEYSKESHLKLHVIKDVVNDMVEIIRGLIGKTSTENEVDSLSSNEKEILLRILGNKFPERVKKLYNLERFCYAYKTEMGKSLIEYLNSSIDGYIGMVYKNTDPVNTVSESRHNICVAILDLWSKKLLARKKFVDDTRQIIYGGSKK